MKRDKSPLQKDLYMVHSNTARSEKLAFWIENMELLYKRKVDAFRTNRLAELAGQFPRRHNKATVLCFHPLPTGHGHEEYISTPGIIMIVHQQSWPRLFVSRKRNSKIRALVHRCKQHNKGIN